MSVRQSQSAPQGEASAADLIASHDAGPGVRVLTLNQPASRNALSLRMMAALQAGLEKASADRNIKTVVLAASGPAFCAGHDLKELSAHRADSDGGAEFYRHTMETCSALMVSIVRLPKPAIAAVEGIATAAGCQLVASADLAVAGKAAKFCTPGVNIGLFCSTPMVALSRNVPRKRAMEMLLLGDLISAEDAAQHGLVNRVVAEGQALQAAKDLAQRIAGKSAKTVSIGKTAFYEQLEMPLADAYRYASDIMVKNMLEADAEEGISAFIEKRPPKWQGC